MERIKVEVDDLLYSEITWKALYASNVSDKIIITILKAGSLNYRKRELYVLEMFFYKRLVRYDFEKLSEILPDMIFKINMATIFICAVFYNEKLTEDHRKILTHRANELAKKLDLYKYWKTSLEILENLNSGGEIVVTEEQRLFLLRGRNKTLQAINDARKKKIA